MGKRGRPKTFESPKRFEMWMSKEDHAELLAESERRGASVSDLARRLIKIGLYVTHDDHEIIIRSKTNPKKREKIKFFL